MKKLFIITCAFLNLAVHASDILSINVDDKNTGVLASAALMTLDAWTNSFLANVSGDRLVLRGDADSVLAALAKLTSEADKNNDFAKIKAILVEHGGAMQFSVASVFEKEPVTINFTLRAMLEKEKPTIDIGALTMTRSHDETAKPVPFVLFHLPRDAAQIVDDVTLAPCLDRSAIVYPLFDADNPSAKTSLNNSTKFINIFSLAIAAYGQAH